MFDIGISQLGMIGVVALIVIGPEKLPRVARTAGTLLGKAQRYVNDVKAEVNRAMELDDLRKMKDSVESAARDVESSIHKTANQVGRDLGGIHASPAEAGSSFAGEDGTTRWFSTAEETQVPTYTPPRKNWRVKRGATPQWYKVRHGVRRQAQSGAARVARFRPRKPQS